MFYSLYLPSLCWMSKHQDYWLNAKVQQTIVPLFVGLFIYFWLFSARICQTNSLKGIPKICLDSILGQHHSFITGVIASIGKWIAKILIMQMCCRVCVFLMAIFWFKFPLVIAVFFITQLFTDRFVSFLNVLVTVTEATCPSRFRARNFRDPL